MDGMDITQKQCTKCKETKDISQFRLRRDIRPNCPIKYDSWCNDCNKQQRHKYYNTHPHYQTKFAPGRKETTKKYRETHKEQLRAMDKIYRENNREKESIRRAKAKRKQREEYIQAYGGKCECCGETTYEFLTIEHKNGGGRRHRAERHGTVIIKEIKDKGWPKDEYGLLCWNCNAAKGVYGYCPHEIKV